MARLGPAADAPVLDRAAPLGQRVAALAARGQESRQRSAELRARATRMADELARARLRLSVVLASAGGRR